MADWNKLTAAVLMIQLTLVSNQLVNERINNPINTMNKDILEKIEDTNA